jgi:5-methyltetrahydropteroyltriglutamate--homocysteine methyltransferase
MLLPTSLVGSYPQPDWLIDRERLSKDVPRIRAENLWRVASDKLEAAQDDATILAIRDQERAGLTIITDGEQRRESYSNRFATALDGIDADNPGTTLSRIGKPIQVPRVVAPIRRKHPVLVRDLKVLRANTDRPVKMTIPGPFTMSKQAQDDYYRDPQAVALGFAAAVNSEIRDLFAAGADIVQIDEPWMQQHPDDARRYGLAALNRALDGVTGTVAVHLCFGYAALVHGKPAGYSFLPELDLHRSGAAAARPENPRNAADQNHCARRQRSGRRKRRDAGARRRAHPCGAGLRAGGTPRRRARLRHEIPAA